MSTTGFPSYANALAGVYDDFKSGDNYRRWAELIAQIARTWGPSGRRLLDVGCGTGVSSFALVDVGFDVTGCDFAPEMLAVAEKSGDRGVSFYLADIRNLPDGYGEFDVVNWMGDVVNHLLSKEDVESAFRSSARVLKSGGILVFDANTAAAYEGLWSSTNVFETAENLFVWRGQGTESDTDGSEVRASALLTVFQQAEGAWGRKDAIVEERYYDRGTLERLFDGVGLKPVRTYGLHGGQLVEPANESVHQKVIYVAKKVS